MVSWSSVKPWRRRDQNPVNGWFELRKIMPALQEVLPPPSSALSCDALIMHHLMYPCSIKE
jgi:hypothetical protein